MASVRGCPNIEGEAMRNEGPQQRGGTNTDPDDPGPTKSGMGSKKNPLSETQPEPQPEE